MAHYAAHNMVNAIKQSPPIDFSRKYDSAWVKNKTIVITGGASIHGFGASFVQHWARHGANVVVGDISLEQGDALVRKINKETGKQSVHFVYCDVMDWQSQVNFFKEAVRLSPHGGIDTVVANAGIAGPDKLQEPEDLSTPEPRKPNLAISEVNITGVLYTTHLAYYWLPRNPGSKACSQASIPAEQIRDRHLLFLGSLASMNPVVANPQYAASKHAVMGLFRTLRSTSHHAGVRVNIICPYFVETPILPPEGRLILAGGSLGRIEDVVDAATRFVADSSILGRGLVVGPRVTVKQQTNGELELVAKGTAGSTEKSLWEPYADDWEDSEQFNRNLLQILNSVQAARGWVGWATDMARTVTLMLGIGRWR